MKVSIVIPAYNEEPRIGKSLEKIKNFVDQHRNAFEIIVVTDGPRDNTVKEVKQFPWVKLIELPENRGKGYALKTGVGAATGDFVYLCDADLSTPISEIDKFLALSAKYDCVIGSRALAESEENTKFLRKLLGKVGNLIINAALNLNIKDTQCGFKLLSKDAAQTFEHLTTDRWGYDFELLFLLREGGYQIKELPISWEADYDYTTFKFSGYFTTLKELIGVWWKHVRFKKRFWQGLWQQHQKLIRYGTIGVLTNVIKLLSYTVGVAVLTFHSVQIWGVSLFDFQIAEIIAQVVMLCFNYFGHKFWTFQSSGFSVSEVLRYLALVITNAIVAFVILTFAVTWFGINKIAAQIITILLTLIWNFFVLKLFVYRNQL